ncbi:uncharacterized protein LOC141656365 [Silene latifolia]|uniref:uncharacterized protein LOC141656365 n=1 Tax=Silene latifolia TaxID=37657 RepID=UPI003D77FE3D
MATRRLLTTTASTTIRRFTTTTTAPRLSLRRTLSAMSHLTLPTLPPSSQRLFSTQQAPYDSNPNNRDSKEKIMLDGCDFEHWLIVMEPPPQEWTREQIIDYYIKTLATAVGSEEEARMKLYSVSTKHYFAFGALIPEEISSRLKDLEKVRWVLPDSYLDVRNKDYGGEPFKNGQAAPYDPKYHEEWVRNNQKAMDRNTRPRHDRTRNFDSRQQRTPGGNMVGAPDQRGPPNNAGYQQNMPQRNNGYQQLPPPNNAGYQQNMPPNNAGNRQNMPPNNAGYQQNMPPTNAGYQPNMPQSNAGYQSNMPPNTGAGFQNAPNGNYQAQDVPGRGAPQ